MMTDTIVPSSKKKEKTSRVTVELLEDGQQPHRRHGAEPHRQEAYTRMEKDSLSFREHLQLKSDNSQMHAYKFVLVHYKVLGW